MGVIPDEFRKVCGLWTTGVSIVTTIDQNGEWYGLTMNGVSSLSLNPPLFLICVDNGSDTLEALRVSQKFAVNILNTHQQAVSDKFSKKGRDKFTGIEIVLGKIGLPLVSDALATIECRITETMPGGDHVVFIGQVEHFTMGKGEPLVFYRGKYIEVVK